VIETLTAFANTKGGKVLIGVQDNGVAVASFTIGKETVQKYLNEIKNKTQPSIIPSADIIDYQGKSVIELSVTEFPVKPVAFKGRYFKRVQNANHQLSAVEISDTYMQSMQYSWDAYPYPKACMASLNKEKIRVFISKVNAAGRFHLSDNPEEAMQKLRMIRDGVPTNAAMILFSKENLLYNVHIGRFKTPSMIIADKMINGNLYDVTEESMQTIIGHLKFAFEITGRTTQRTEIPEYPLDAIREMLLNCLIHRDYRSSTDIQIKIFDQKITFFNPGRLYGNITAEELLTDAYQASTRNKQIAEAFYLTHDIEKYGSGFIRIRQAIADYPTMQFNFCEFGDGFVSEFSYTEQKVSTKDDKNLVENAEISTGKDYSEEQKKGTVKGTVKFTDYQQKIMEAAENNPFITGEELVQIVGISLSKIRANIAKLKSKGLLKRIGSDRSGYWQIIDENAEKLLENIEINTEKDHIEEQKKGTVRGTVKGTVKLTDYQQKIMEAAENNPFITGEELVQIVGISLSKIRENVAKLKSKGFLKRIGSDKSGHWQTIDKKNK
jgi:ATP-dependent DNA helicase RecG